MDIMLLQQVIAALFPAAVFQTDYMIKVDSSGNATIALWNNAIGTQPTADQLTAEATTLQLQQAQTAQIAVLTSAYTTARYGSPVSLTAGSVTLSFPSSQACQTNVMGYLVAYSAANAPASMPLEDNSGAIQMLTYAELQTLAQNIANNSMTVWQKLMTLIGQVQAATTTATVAAVVWS